MNKRKTDYSDKNKEILIQKVLYDEIDLDTALVIHSLTLRPSIFEIYIEPIFIGVLISMIFLIIISFLLEFISIGGL